MEELNKYCLRTEGLQVKRASSCLLDGWGTVLTGGSVSIKGTQCEQVNIVLNDWC